ncbi:MAG: ATP-grasp domain-containing protein [Candidatus Sericytochromatia bacterium]
MTSWFNSERPVAVVYPTFSVNCYGVIRSLGEQGIPVVALDEQSSPNAASRYCKALRCPSPKADPEQFAAWLAEFGSQFRTRPVLYMMEDLYVYLAHRYRDRLEPQYRFPFMTEEALFDCIDKRRTFEVAARLGIPLPPTWYPEDLDGLAAIRDELRYPVIIKPIVARFDCRGGQVSKICEFPNRYQSKAVQANDWNELVALFQEVKALDVVCCVQELIPGDQDQLYGSTMYVDDTGEVQGIFVRTKLRQTPWDFGTMTLGRAAASPEIVDISKRLVEAIGFRGICGMEFKYDARDRQYKLLEINPRGELWMNLASRCGVNLPLLKYQDQIGEPLYAVQTDFERRMVDLRDDFSLYFMRYRRDVGQDHHVGLAEWATSLMRRDLEEVIFNWRDPMPGLLRYGHYLGRVLGTRVPELPAIGPRSTRPAATH